MDFGGHSSSLSHNFVLMPCLRKYTQHLNYFVRFKSPFDAGYPDYKRSEFNCVKNDR